MFIATRYVWECCYSEVWEVTVGWECRKGSENVLFTLYNSTLRIRPKKWRITSYRLSETECSACLKLPAMCGSVVIVKYGRLRWAGNVEKVVRQSA